jgi:hypothetical protein
MNAIDADTTVGSTEVRILLVLEGAGSQTLERLAELSGMSWAQVFLAIDRLSRSGTISLRQNGSREYHVSINKAIA